MRLRHRSAGLPREAASDPDLRRRLESARLYVITPNRDADRILDIAAAAMRGGADILQLRHKTLPRGELLRVAMRMRALTTAGGALFIVNDYADIAIISGADGVHLGHDDMSLESARQVVGASMLIGASASKPEDARAAHAADYIGSGPVFSTPMKAEKGVIDPAGVAAVASAVNKPVFAIGGIDELNLVRLTALGIRRACVIRAVADASDPQAVTRRLRAMLDA